MSRQVRTTIAVAVAAASLAGLGACGDDGGAPAASPTSSAPTSGTPTAETPASGGSGSAPAMALDGPVATLDVGTVQAPAGWTAKRGQAAWQTSLAGPVREGGLVIFSDIDDHVFGTSPSPDAAALDARVKVIRRDAGRSWVRKPDVMLGGLPFFHLVDDSDSVVYREEFGSVHNGRDADLDFEFTKVLTKPAKRRALIDAMAASFRPS
ncbi:hypothetical protein P5P86_00135 [Nocardioides sp. BP30]|uniref:hypothetical protein n=1 Tax=Nocardioides sp. BP30 TaxID=3036374 RepID=UPI0024688539|nr:hypothetical protein [Nocardioides sp. BP30]WGL52256.1 hypothetical protein P5P86_00135 [Nocardioides sp. BP30]